MNLLELPSSKGVVTRRYPMAAWSAHVPFGYDFVAELKPRVLVELGTYFGESYFTFCQSVRDNKLSSVCYAVDNWKGDAHVGDYGDNVFDSVNSHNATNYQAFSYLLRMTFDDAAKQFGDDSIDLLHIDGFHTYDAVKHDYETWIPKVSRGG